ncbi:hypothetical protein N9A79_01075, partial [Pirellulales bacterium]|nr:hypothetical protein [Pirellulales bacterium]
NKTGNTTGSGDSSRQMAELLANHIRPLGAVAKNKNSLKNCSYQLSSCLDIVPHQHEIHLELKPIYHRPRAAGFTTKANRNYRRLEA